MLSEKEIEEKFCKLSYKEISKIISGFTSYAVPIETIKKQELFQTALFDSGDEFLKEVEEFLKKVERA